MPPGGRSRSTSVETRSCATASATASQSKNCLIGGFQSLTRRDGPKPDSHGIAGVSVALATKRIDKVSEPDVRRDFARRRDRDAPIHETRDYAALAGGSASTE